ncbi:transcriptional regulator [Synergistales bacterium]|nr:transcriptional regulator [Synergistales bacterium]GHV50507.1 transcriptional regulator [Synergistales bacterium]
MVVPVSTERFIKQLIILRGRECGMTKAELANSVAESVKGLTKKRAAEVIEALLASIKEALAKGEKIHVVDFGSFEVQDRAARMGRNLRNPKEVIQIPPKKAPVFHAGKGLREAVNAQKK